ncbi:MAG: hypothetical protein ABH967_01565 [Patescibacteria group bacterium]
MDQIEESEENNISLTSIEAIAILSLAFLFDILSSIFSFIPFVGTIVCKIIYLIAFALIGSWIFIRSNNLPNSSVGDKGFKEWIQNNWQDLTINLVSFVNIGLVWTRFVLEQFIGKIQLNPMNSLFKK